MEQLPLVDILKVFNNPISEEQAWAVCYQCSQFLLVHPLQEYFQGMVDFGIHSIWLSRQGEIEVQKSNMEVGTRVDHCSSDGCAHSTTESTRVQPSIIATETHAVQALGGIIFQTLDYGIDSSEERALSRELESLIEAMTKARCSSDVELDVANAAADEGIVGDADVEHGCFMQDVIKMCCQHVSSSQDAQQHYRAVCRALATEASELFTFLDRISSAKERLSDDQDVDARKLEELQRADWACMWVQVMRSLRQGVLLKKVEHTQLPPVEYELTPFEILMEDIRSRRYTLHKIMVGDHKLKKQRSHSPDLHERLLREIRSKPKLRPVRGGKLVVETIRPRLSIDSDQDSPSPPKQLIKPDLGLIFQYSFEESGDEDILKSCSVKSSPELDISFTSGTTTPPLPPCHRADAFLFEDKPSSATRLHRRHTISVCDTPRDRKKNARSPIEYLSLTLEELTHIRAVFTKAELESLAWHPQLYQQVSKRKLCFTCRTTRFTLFGEWGTKCKICQTTVCSKCISKMNVPTDHFRNIPVYSLSPSLLTGEIQELVQKTIRSVPAPSVPQTRASSPTRDQESSNWQQRQHNERKPQSMDLLAEDISTDILNLSKHGQNRQSVNLGDHKKGPLIRQSLKGTLMAICCECREMVIEIIRSSRQSLAALSLPNSSRQMSTFKHSHKKSATRYLTRE